MKVEFVIRTLTKASRYLSQDQLKKLKSTLDEELYSYSMTTNCTDIALINNTAENIGLFLADKKYVQNLSANTVDGYFRTLNKFARTITKDVDKIDSIDIRTYIAYIAPSIQPSSLASAIWNLKAFFSWLLENDKITKNPMKPIKAPKCDKKLRKPLNKEELESVRDIYKTYREKSLFEFVYSTGCRLDEFQKLNKKDIDWAKRRVVVFGKGNKERVVGLNAKAELNLRRYLALRTDNNPALFVTERNPHDRLGRRGIQRVFKDLGIRAGLNRPLFPHLIRHTTATNMLDSGTPIHLVSKYLGHESLETTKIYTEINQEDVLMSCQRCLN